MPNEKPWEQYNGQAKPASTTQPWEQYSQKKVVAAPKVYGTFDIQQKDNLESILNDEALRYNIIKDELKEMKEKYGDQPVLVFAAEGMLEDFRERGVNVVDTKAALAGGKHGAVAVVIGWDTNFGKDKIQLAAEAIRDGAELYTTSYAPMFASADRLNVGVSGFITSGLMFVTGKKDFEILGKPSQHSMNVVSRVLGTPKEEILVIGDDIKLESTMARNGGALAGLVLTGTSSREDAENADPSVQPELIVESMTELNELFAQADQS